MYLGFVLYKCKTRNLYIIDATFEWSCIDWGNNSVFSTLI